MQRVAVKLNGDRTRHVLILVHALLYNREKVCVVLYEQKEKAGAGFVCKHGDEWDGCDGLIAFQESVQTVLRVARRHSS